MFTVYNIGQLVSSVWQSLTEIFCKRQTGDIQLTRCFLRRCRMFGDTISSDSEPVSYTHLDVYKRQARTSARVQLQGTTSAGAPAR